MQGGKETFTSTAGVRMLAYCDRPLTLLLHAVKTRFSPVHGLNQLVYLAAVGMIFYPTAFCIYFDTSVLAAAILGACLGALGRAHCTGDPRRGQQYAVKASPLCALLRRRDVY